MAKRYSQSYRCTVTSLDDPALLELKGEVWRYNRSRPEGAPAHRVTIRGRLGKNSDVSPDQRRRWHRYVPITEASRWDVYVYESHPSPRRRRDERIQAAPHPSISVLDHRIDALTTTAIEFKHYIEYRAQQLGLQPAGAAAAVMLAVCKVFDLEPTDPSWDDGEDDYGE